MRIFHFLILILALGCKTNPESKEIQQWEQQAQQVEIIRDDYGIPHVYGKTDADAVFGMIYAQCEDDFYRVEQNYIWAMGRLAEIEGEEALYSDVRANLFMTEQEAKAAYEKAPATIKKLCQAFADGANYYLHTHPKEKPRLISRFEPWMPLFFSEGSIGGDIERVELSDVEGLYGSPMRVPESKDELLIEPQGSNGIAISGKLTKSGNAMLLINPHTSFYFRGEMHMVSEEGLNAYGAVTWGQFFIYQGFNEKTGWMHTSTYTDVLDEYKETIEKREGKLYYKYGKEMRPVDSVEVQIKYKTEIGLAIKPFTLYRTHHGPITHLEDGQWTATAMMWEPVKALEQAFIRTKQEGYKGFREMMDLRTNSSNNTVYADAEGNIAYFHGNFIPVRDTLFDFTRPVDGSNPATDWKGLHTVDENILIKNPPNGWIQNCNSTPYTAAGEYSPKRENYPVYMSRDQENFRGIHAIQLLQEGRDYTLDDLMALAHDPYLPAFKALLPGLVEAYDKAGKWETLKEAVAILREWDFKTSESSVAMTLAHYYGTKCFDKAYRPEGLYEMELVHYWGSDLFPDDQKLELFTEVLEELQSKFGSWKKPWGDVHRYQRINGDIRQAFNDSLPSIPVGFASGRWGALAAYGARYHNNTNKIYGTRGNSFAAVVTFGEKVKAKSILAGGQSGDPESPHFDDQINRFLSGDWKEVPFYKEDVMKKMVRRYRPGE